MAQPYLGEIRMFAGNFSPAGWQFCDGSLLAISENETLFNLIGTTYGGDGQSFFAVPDLRGRVPVHQGNGYVVGAAGGVEQVTLGVDAIPSHFHAFMASANPGTSANAGGNTVAATTSIALYIEDSSSLSPLLPQAVAAAGGSQPHDNMQPFVCISFIISLYGPYPVPS